MHVRRLFFPFAAYGEGIPTGRTVSLVAIYAKTTTAREVFLLTGAAREFGVGRVHMGRSQTALYGNAWSVITRMLPRVASMLMASATMEISAFQVRAAISSVPKRSTLMPRVTESWRNACLVAFMRHTLCCGCWHC